MNQLFVVLIRPIEQQQNRIGIKTVVKIFERNFPAFACRSEIIDRVVFFLKERTEINPELSQFLFSFSFLFERTPAEKLTAPNKEAVLP